MQLRPTWHDRCLSVGTVALFILSLATKSTIAAPTDTAPAATANRSNQTSGARENCELAAEYNASHKGISMVVMKDGKLVYENYPNGGSATYAHELASGTKSFNGVVAIAAEEDGLLTLDEKVSDTITEWKKDPLRRQITIRQLLTLTSGVKGSVGRAPTYAEAIKAEVVPPIGEKFQYGAEPFQIFGEVMRRKLSKTHETEVDYLKRRVLNPAGIKVGKWREGADGMPLLPQGAAFTAREWAKFGELVRLKGRAPDGKQIISPERFDVLFEGTTGNPMYGLTWWLNRPIDDALRASVRTLTAATDLKYGTEGVPNDMVMAAGAGNQRLYIIPSENLVIVRQAAGISDLLMGGGDRDFSDNEFVRRVILGTPGPGRIKSGITQGNDNRGQMRDRVLKKFDKNGDGKLNLSEKRQLLQLMRKARQQQR